MFFCIDLDSRNPQVMEYSGENLAFDIDYFKVKNAMELDNYDRRVFDNEDKAEEFLETYSQVLKGLSNSKICKSRALPAMLYKRRYMVQTLMGDKLQTYRHYKKNWQAGQLINLHDQTFFLTVRLKSITETPQGFCYKFELP